MSASKESKLKVLRRVHKLFGESVNTLGPIMAVATQLDDNIFDVYEGFSDDVLSETLKALADVQGFGGPRARHRGDDILELLELKQAMASLQLSVAELKAREYTFTDVAGIGRAIQQHTPPIDAGTLGIDRVSADSLPGKLKTKMRSLVRQMSKARKEQQLQGPMYSAIRLLAEWREYDAFVLDTHKSGYGGIKIQRPGISLSLVPEKLITQMVSFIELKVELESSTHQHEVLGQMKQRLSYVLRHQPGRRSALAMGLSSRQLMLMKCYDNGDVNFSAAIDIDWLNNADEGWQVLLGFLSVKPHMAGYVDAILPPPVALPGGHVLQDYVAIATRTSVGVYRAHVMIHGQWRNFVLKAGKERSIKHEAELLKLPAVEQCKHLPTVITQGRFQPPTQGGFDTYFVVKDYGVHITSAAAPAAIIRFFEHAAHGLQTLTSAGHMHCDISPDNLEVVFDREAVCVGDQRMQDTGQQVQSESSEPSCQPPGASSSDQCSETGGIEAAMETNSSSLRCIVLDLHVAQPTAQLASSQQSAEQLNAAPTSSRPAAVSGKPPFFGLSVHLTGLHSTSADLESLFLCALDIVSDGAAIRWRRVCYDVDFRHDMMFESKCSNLLVDPIWQRKVLPRCNVPELRDWLNQLRKLFYSAAAGNDSATAAAGGSFQGYNSAVTHDQFITVCKKAQDSLNVKASVSQMQVSE